MLKKTAQLANDGFPNGDVLMVIIMIMIHAWEIMKMTIITIIMMFLPGSALAEYAIILSIYTLELDKREYQINQASQMMMMMMMMMIYGNIDISILLLCH